MTAHSGHFDDDEIQDTLDGRLSPEARRQLETHLEGCLACRRRLETLAWVKQQAARVKETVAAPPELALRIAQVLDEEDRAHAPTRAQTAGRGVRWGPRLAWAGAAAAALLLAIFYSPRGVDLPSAVARDYGDLRSGSLPLTLETADVKKMEAFFSAHASGVRTRVFDLGMMRYRLVGGRVHTLAGRPTSLFVYRGENGHTVMCQMYVGGPALPEGSELRQHQGITFSVYQRAGVTLVFWQEGQITCVLAGDGVAEAVIQLAYAKAMKAAAVGGVGSRLAHR